MQYAECILLSDLAAEWEAEQDDVSRFEQLCGELDIEATSEALREFADDVTDLLILERDFVLYAQELAEDITTVRNVWPDRYIDWDAAASDLADDYTLVSYNGNNYYVYSC